MMDKRNAKLSSQTSQDSQPSDSGLGGFFGSMASAAETNESDSPTSDYFSSQESSIANTSKTQELESRLDTLSRRLTAALDRLDLAEKKIRRLEGRE